ncbi:putative transcription factor B3-Domain family [Medicago truncatula]|uniref:Putative transcription factor B3-Domain family n=1 Tax=Medicago truncatula TaxID=3880 RepID=A2Q3B7_MEDTR|nr:Transcriptional factor B3 [Medicago truncatula]RHN74332.1 putative transcription factor B3-Domain family [Medicago truncatula]
MSEIGVEVNGTELWNVQNVDVHYWKHKVIASILDGNNVLHFPRRVAENCLYINQSKILLFDEDGKSYDCDVHTTSKNMHQKYIGRGWYNFVLEKDLKVGDVILFTVNNPPNQVYATVVNWDWDWD